jgi:hypothetical protein
MATEIVRGPVSPSDHLLPEPFAVHAAATLNSRTAKVDPVAQGLMLCQRARDCLQAARTARQCGHQDLALAWLRSAEFFRVAASVWRQRARGAWMAFKARTP